MDRKEANEFEKSLKAALDRSQQKKAEKEKTALAALTESHVREQGILADLLARLSLNFDTKQALRSGLELRQRRELQELVHSLNPLAPVGDHRMIDQKSLVEGLSDVEAIEMLRGTPGLAAFPAFERRFSKIRELGSTDLRRRLGSAYIAKTAVRQAPSATLLRSRQLLQERIRSLKNEHIRKGKRTNTEGYERALEEMLRSLFPRWSDVDRADLLSQISAPTMRPVDAASILIARKKGLKKKQVRRLGQKR